MQLLSWLTAAETPDSGDKVRVKKGVILQTRWSLKQGDPWNKGGWVGPKILWHSAVSISVSQLAGGEGLGGQSFPQDSN